MRKGTTKKPKFSVSNFEELKSKERVALLFSQSNVSYEVEVVPAHKDLETNHAAGKWQKQH